MNKPSTNASRAYARSPARRDAWIMDQLVRTQRKDRPALRRLDLLPRLGCGPAFDEIPTGWDRV